MSDGQGSAPSTPPGWAENQPPPHASPGQTPWTSPGDSAPHDSGPSAGQAPAGAPGQVPPGQAGPQGYAPPYGPPQGGPAPGAQAPYGQQNPYARQQGPYGPGPQNAGYGQAPWQGAGHGFRPPPQALRPGIIPLRPLGLGDILDGTIKLIRSNPKATLGLSAVAAAIGTLPLAIGQAMYYGSVGGLISEPGALETADEVPLGGVIAQFGGALISVVIQFFLVTVLTGMLTRVLGRAVFGGRVTIGEAWRLTRSRLPALFGLALLTGLIVLVPFALGVALVVGLVAANASGGVIAFTVLVLVMAFVAYALFITTRLALASPAVVLERRGVTDAMRRSWRLVSGDFWRVLGILVLTQIMVSVLGGILSVPVTIVSMVVSLGGQGSLAATVVTTVLFAIGGVLSSMITYPIQAGVNGLLYTDRRMRAEAFDLVLHTAAVEQQRLGWVPATADELWHPSHAAGSGVPGSPVAP
ncbi:membrane protein [Sphaerisporangium melleum]|uniref:Membrane protein n=1 Tax=Sphaerisporangium melleum TaxID=321316 RepID=A0A917QRX6_9ACTN|nr:glycerophosphoryl diester phosphodiesterase membrane domain-containing protein [Sphaerisporangium melleum]GGK64781.1 membrane protein [Sphaerisporangium melleum]GII70036.1 membrane protein [Sphaerisporangium melleum]